MVSRGGCLMLALPCRTRQQSKSEQTLWCNDVLSVIGVVVDQLSKHTIITLSWQLM